MYNKTIKYISWQLHRYKNKIDEIVLLLKQSTKVFQDIYRANSDNKLPRKSLYVKLDSCKVRVADKTNSKNLLVFSNK